MRNDETSHQESFTLQLDKQNRKQGCIWVHINSFQVTQNIKGRKKMHTSKKHFFPKANVHL